MDPASPRFFFDYTDPVSFVVEEWVRGAEETLGVTVVRHPLEIVPPPGAPVDPESEAWRARWTAARERTRRPLVRPAMVPWTRKAHEAALHARESGLFTEIHGALFRAHHVEGLDIGRVDVLADIARREGLDPGELRTALGVDRHLEDLLELRRTAERLGVAGVPSLLRDGRRLDGPADPDEVRSFVRPTPS